MRVRQEGQVLLRKQARKSADRCAVGTKRCDALERGSSCRAVGPLNLRLAASNDPPPPPPPPMPMPSPQHALASSTRICLTSRSSDSAAGWPDDDAGKTTRPSHRGSETVSKSSSSAICGAGLRFTVPESVRERTSGGATSGGKPGETGEGRGAVDGAEGRVGRGPEENDGRGALPRRDERIEGEYDLLDAENAPDGTGGAIASISSRPSSPPCRHRTASLSPFAYRSRCTTMLRRR